MWRFRLAIRVRGELTEAVITKDLAAVEVLAFEVQITEAADHSILDEFNFATLRVKASF